MRDAVDRAEVASGDGQHDPADYRLMERVVAAGAVLGQGVGHTGESVGTISVS